MFHYSLRASTVACFTAFFAFPAVADTMTLTIVNRFEDTISELYLDASDLSARAGNRVPVGGLPRFGSITFDVVCRPYEHVYDGSITFSSRVWGGPLTIHEDGWGNPNPQCDPTWYMVIGK